MDEMRAFLSKRYAHYDDLNELLDAFEAAWEGFRPFADSQFVIEFCKGDDDVMHQRFSELYLSKMCIDSDLQMVKQGNGPDIQVEIPDASLWIEMVTPTFGSVMNEDIEAIMEMPEIRAPIKARSVPVNEILSRWTSVIATKAKVFAGYESKGIIKKSDPRLIAINSARLGSYGFIGISQHPTAIEAVYPVGPLQVHIDRLTGETTATDYAYRPKIKKENASEIDTDGFLGTDYSHIGGILAFHKSVDGLLNGGQPDRILVHNLNADVPVPDGIFKNVVEYMAEEDDEGKLRIRPI